MASEHDNDEILDSSFPVDFGTESEALDLYGVWVKSGPRDASAEKPSLAPIVTSRSEESEEFLELPDLPDLPDVPLRDDDTLLTDETIEGLEDSPEAPSPFEDTLDSLEDLSFDETLAVSFDESAGEPYAVSRDDDIGSSEEGGILRSDDDSSLPAADSDDHLLVDFSDSDFTLDLPEQNEERETVNERIVEESVGEIEVAGDDASFFAEESVTEESDDELSVGFLDDLSDTLPEMEIPLDEETLESASSEPDADEKDTLVLGDDSGPEIPVVIDAGSFNVGQDDSLPADDDFSDFLNDLNTGDAKPAVQASSSDSLDLDSFINEFNETGGTPADERDKLFEDVEPVEIDLDFDESFIEDSERIKASGSSVSEHEFLNSEFGVELVDETGASDTISFDERIIDEAGVGTETDQGSPAPVPSEDGLETATEFDDLLASLDAAPTSQVVKETKKPAQASNTFELHVTEEDGLGSVAANVTSERTDEDIAVDLFHGQQTAVQEEDSFGDLSVRDLTTSDDEENLDILEIKDYNVETSGQEMDVSLDFDDISAVEQELSDGIPETGEDAVVSNDKSTELLMVIADELSSIKQEISTLKAELAGFKGMPQTGESPGATGQDAADNSGFFSDDDNDEAIALTGDELNNILITADFTEEKTDEPPQEAAEIDVTSGFIDEETPPVEIAFSPETELVSDEPEIPETLPDSLFDVPDLDTASEIPVTHVNTIDDDISYLDGNADQEPDLDNVAIEEPDLEIIDFNDEKLEEPELTEFDIDLADLESGFPAEQTVAVEPHEEPAVEEVLPPLEDTTIDVSGLEVGGIETGGEAQSRDSVSDEKESATAVAALPIELKDEIKSVLSYMDQLLESLPEEKIEEFARSEHFEVYRKLFEELGIS